ncbi:hypothetical protein F4803DRAFT_63752 [Xylaria telfairii]|nr:hypothetical protein F4803DRAFT_63752 [Xylaria telfairii]
MSFSAGARLVRVQPAHLRHAVRHRTFSASTIPLRLSLGWSQAHRYSPIASLPASYSNNASQTQFRLTFASSASQPRSSITSLEKPPSELISDPLNPPASTRPPPLDVPARDPSTNLFIYLFRVGKAYTTFYKTGLKAILTNRRLSRNLPATTTPTRADVLLYRRVRHDLRRLPLFAVILLLCGELTPFIILLFPSLSPYTCRIPAQVAAVRRSLQARRDASFRSLSYIDKADLAALTNVTDGHICRSLGLGSPLWDKIGFDVPWARRRGLGMARWIAADDAMLRNGGGVRALVDDEVVLACDARGIDTLEKDVASLRRRLEAWVAGSAPSEAKEGDFEAAVKESTGKVRRLFLRLDGTI